MNKTGLPSIKYSEHKTYTRTEKLGHIIRRIQGNRSKVSFFYKAFNVNLTLTCVRLDCERTTD